MWNATERGDILIVEDPFVRHYVRALLLRHGYKVTEAEPVEAMDALNEAGGHIGLLITNSPTYFRQFGDRVPLVYLAASPDPEIASHFKSCRMLPKPFHPGELVAAVDELTHAV